MTHRLLPAAGLLAALLFTASAADKKDAEAAKKGLQEVGEFVGTWNTTGDRWVAGKKTPVKEGIVVGWKFKDGDAWIGMEIKDGKFLTGGDLRFLPDKKVYQLTAKDTGGKEIVFEGKVNARRELVLKGTDAAGDLHTLTLGTLDDGARLVAKSELQVKGKGLASDEYKVAGGKEGEKFAGGKKPECCVTGGLGTSTVSFNGKTYYVCCSGCREEFNANPKKYADEFDKKKK